MPEVVVTRKGQVTIPVELRRKFGIEENSKVEIVEQDGMIIIKKRPRFSISREAALERSTLTS
jgi:AbrB family looped-hinge helix DNA binding protein